MHSAVTTIRIEDISMLTSEEPESELNLAIRQSTAGFEDWVTRMLKAVCRIIMFRSSTCLTTCRNQERIKSLVATLKKAWPGPLWYVISYWFQATCNTIFVQLSDSLYDLALDIFYRHVSTTAKSNSIKWVGMLAGCFARANGVKTFKKLFPICAMTIRAELEHGASSSPSTHTSQVSM